MTLTWITAMALIAIVCWFLAGLKLGTEKANWVMLGVAFFAIWFVFGAPKL